MERGPPDAFFYPGSGPSIGRRHGPAPGFGFEFETTSDQIDSALPQKRMLGASVLFVAAGKEWAEGIVANSPKRWNNPPAYRPVVRRVSL